MGRLTLAGGEEILRLALLNRRSSRPFSLEFGVRVGPEGPFLLRRSGHGAAQARAYTLLILLRVPQKERWGYQPHSSDSSFCSAFPTCFLSRELWGCVRTI